MKRRQFTLCTLLAIVTMLAGAFAIVRQSGLFQDGVWDVTEVQLLDYTRPDMPGIDFHDEFVATCRDGRRTIYLVCGKTQTLFVGDSFHITESKGEPNAIDVGGIFVVLHSP